MKKIYLSSLLLVLAIFVYANYSGTVVTNQNELSFSTIDNYDVISIKNGFYTEEIGAPQLPVKILSFLIPADKKVSSIVINNTSIVQLYGTYNIYPVQTPVPTNMSVSSFPFDDPDPLIYGSNIPYPGILFEVHDDGYPMGYHVVTIKFYPVEYLPSSGILNLYTNIDFTIVYENNTDNILFPLRQSQYSNNISKQHIRRMVENPNDIDIISGGAKEIIANASNISNTRGMSPTSLINIPDYIIITQNSLISSFQVLADWKTQKGIYALVVDVQDIYDNYQGIDNAEKIRNYLKDVYVNFGSSFILLGGDVEIIPARNTPIYSGIFVTDYYYATVQGNWNANGNNIFGETYSGFGKPDIDNPDLNNVFFVGRAPVNIISEADNFVNKVIGYEKFDNPNISNWDFKFFFFKSINSPSTFEIGEGFGDYDFPFPNMKVYSRFPTITSNVCLTVDGVLLYGTNDWCGFFPYSILESNLLDVGIFPNPCTDFFNIQIHSFYDNDVRFNLFNINGQLAKSEILQNNGTGNFSINVSNLPKGVYILNIQSKTKQFNQKVIIN